MKISFVIIVLNGMPFIRASLKNIYEKAYEIVIVEGAVKNCMFAANSDGSSTDGTVNFIKSFPDPLNKIRLIQGAWPEKCEMQNEALKIISGDYIWLVDSDELYKEKDMNMIIQMLVNDSTITEICFPAFHFWKGFDYIISSKPLENAFFHRIFKLNRPCFFTTHRPPTLFWEGQNKTTDKMNLLEATILRKEEIYIYHYSYLLEEQVKQKIELYKRYGWGRIWNLDLSDWYFNCFLKWTPENKSEIEKKYGIWTCDKDSGTERFIGIHPKSIVEIKQCLK